MNMEIALFMAHLCLIVPALYDYPDVSCQEFEKLAKTSDIANYSFNQLETAGLELRSPKFWSCQRKALPSNCSLLNLTRKC